MSRTMIWTPKNTPLHLFTCVYIHTYTSRLLSPAWSSLIKFKSMYLPSLSSQRISKKLSMIVQNDFKSIVPVHHLNPPPFLGLSFLTITFPIVGKDWYQYQICAELSRLQHQRVGPERVWFYCRKGQHLERGEIFWHSWGEGSGGILGNESREKEEGCVQVRRDGARAGRTQESVLVIKKDKPSSMPTTDKLLTPAHIWTSDCPLIVEPLSVHRGQTGEVSYHSSSAPSLTVGALIQCDKPVH